MLPPHSIEQCAGNGLLLHTFAFPTNRCCHASCKCSIIVCYARSACMCAATFLSAGLIVNTGLHSCLDQYASSFPVSRATRFQYLLQQISPSPAVSVPMSVQCCCILFCYSLSCSALVPGTPPHDAFFGPPLRLCVSVWVRWVPRPAAFIGMCV